MLVVTKEQFEKLPPVHLKRTLEPEAVTNIHGGTRTLVHGRNRSLIWDSTSVGLLTIPAVNYECYLTGHIDSFDSRHYTALT